MQSVRPDSGLLNGRLWAYHPQPLPDELLSSWLVRIAHGHGEKVQTFCSLEFGKKHEVWNRDIDRQAPTWLMNRISNKTGVSLADAYQTTLRSYRLHLYSRHHATGIQQWILPLEIWHRKHMGHGLQFCPACLAEDAVPYYRKRWRVALYTCCTKHNAMIHDRCPACGTGVAFHRIELGRYGNADDGPLTYCHECGFDIRNSPVIAPIFYEDSSWQLMLGVLNKLEGIRCRKFDVGFFNVLHQLCKILLANIKHVRLREHVIGQIGAPDVALKIGKIGFEERNLHERYHVIQLGLWLMVEPSCRLIEAWRAKNVRYNVLKRDLQDIPPWFRKIVEKCSDWRKT